MIRLQCLWLIIYAPPPHWKRGLLCIVTIKWQNMGTFEVCVTQSFAFICHSTKENTAPKEAFAAPQFPLHTYTNDLHTAMKKMTKK